MTQPVPAAGSSRRDRRPGHRRSFMLYIVSGVASVATHYTFTVIAVELLDWRALFATSAGFIVGAVTKYVMNYFLAFESEEPHGAAIARFLVMLGALFLANAALFWWLHDYRGYHYMVAQVLTTGVLVPVGYVINRHWVFR
jgi:putative flippase GtrA